MIEGRPPSPSGFAIRSRGRAAWPQTFTPLEFAPQSIKRWPLTLGLLDPSAGRTERGEVGPLRVFANPAELEAATQNGVLRVACRAEGLIRGALQDPKGQPVAFAQIVSLDKQKRRFDFVSSRVAVTDALGNFDLAVPTACSRHELFLLRAGAAPLLISADVTAGVRPDVELAGTALSEDSGDREAFLVEPESSVVRLHLVDHVGQSISIPEAFEVQRKLETWSDSAFGVARTAAMSGAMPRSGRMWTAFESAGPSSPIDRAFGPLVLDDSRQFTAPRFVVVDDTTLAMRVPLGTSLRFVLEASDGRLARGLLPSDPNQEDVTVELKSTSASGALKVMLDLPDSVMGMDVRVMDQAGWFMRDWSASSTCLGWSPHAPREVVEFNDLEPGTYRVQVNVTNGRNYEDWSATVEHVVASLDPVDAHVDLQKEQPVRFSGGLDATLLADLARPIRAGWPGSVLQELSDGAVHGFGFEGPEFPAVRVVWRDLESGALVQDREHGLWRGAFAVELAPGDFFYEVSVGGVLLQSGVVSRAEFGDDPIEIALK